MYKQHIILDFEMNPVSKKFNDVREHLHREIIEIGAIKLNSNGEVVDTFSCFIKPQFSTDVAGYITKLTGIKTADIYQAASFQEAIQRFAQWIGTSMTRIYSWSNADLIQLRTECSFKQVAFPANMARWMDFQILFPRLMEIKQYKNRMSLQEAAEWYGVTFDNKGAHRALYDAKITTELVIPVLTGEYMTQRDCLKKAMQKDEEEEKNFGFCLADLCNSFLGQLVSNDRSEPEYVS